MTTFTLKLGDARTMAGDGARKPLVPSALRDLLDEVGQVLKGSLIGMPAAAGMDAALRRDIGMD